MSFLELGLNYGNPLCERNSDGIHVALFAKKVNDTHDIRVFCEDKRTGESFTLDPPTFLALDAYQHPFAYANAALRGIENPNRLVPVA